MNKSTKLIYIASNEHSGSTLLELFLASHSGISGSGETHMLVDETLRRERLPSADTRICTCGKTINKCPLWSAFLDSVAGDGSGDFSVSYNNLLQLARSEFGEESILVDSSKYIAPLKKIISAEESHRLCGIEIFVIHLIKDVRCFATSMKWRYNLNSWQLFSKLRKWYRSNLEMEQFLSQNAVPHIRIGYEELCFNPKRILMLICDKIGAQFDEQMLDIRNASAHIGVGNPMRNHPVKRNQLIYDNRWFHETTILLWYLLSPRIRRYNKKSVYQHLNANLISRLFEPLKT